MEPDPKHFFVTQSGLLGDGLPTHNTAYGPRRGYSLGRWQDTLQVRLKARDASGAEVTKPYTLPARQLPDRRRLRHRERARTSRSPATAYYQFLRDGNPPSEEAAQTNAFAGVTTFTGPAVYTEATKFQKVDFSDIAEGQADPREESEGWLDRDDPALLRLRLAAEGRRGARVLHQQRRRQPLYRRRRWSRWARIAPGATASIDVPLYIGPQETEKLEKVAPGLELVVDYGWLHILAAPLFWLLKWIHALVGNWGWSIIILTILIKLVFYPLNAKAGRSMAQMKVLAPKMEKLKQLYGDDRQKMNQAMMELYKTEKINPLGGCLPILVQIPVFIALYWVLLASIELRHAPWLGWIQDLSAPDPYFILPVIYAISMFVQTKLNPQPADPVQAQGHADHAHHVQRVLPLLPVGPGALLGGPEPDRRSRSSGTSTARSQPKRRRRPGAERRRRHHRRHRHAARAAAASAWFASRAPRARAIAQAIAGRVPQPRHATLADFLARIGRGDRQRPRALLSRAAFVHRRRRARAAGPWRPRGDARAAAPLRRARRARRASPASSRAARSSTSASTSRKPRASRT